MANEKQTYEEGTRVRIIAGDLRGRTGTYVKSYVSSKSEVKARITVDGMKNPNGTSGDYYIDEKMVMDEESYCLTKWYRNSMYGKTIFNDKVAFIQLNTDGVLTTNKNESAYPNTIIGKVFDAMLSKKVQIDKVYFNFPYTIVIWKDKTKTIVKLQDGDFYTPETGLALCIAKKALGNTNKWYDVFKEWLPKEDDDGKSTNMGE